MKGEFKRIPYCVIAVVVGQASSRICVRLQIASEIRRKNITTFYSSGLQNIFFSKSQHIIRLFYKNNLHISDIVRDFER